MGTGVKNSLFLSLYLAKIFNLFETSMGFAKNIYFFLLPEKLIGLNHLFSIS